MYVSGLPTSHFVLLLELVLLPKKQNAEPGGRTPLKMHIGNCFCRPQTVEKLQ